MTILDVIDHRILAALESDGRMSTLDVAEAVGLSPTPCSRRIKRLEDAGVIAGYRALVDPRALGLNISVIVSVRLARQGPDGHSQFLEAIKGRSEVSQCLLVTGNIDYLLRVWVKDIEALREFITETLQSIPTVAETSTMLVVGDVEIRGNRGMQQSAQRRA
jgi:Lrp/AsnC family transcriptional regulator, leucine-responsive regulatory protein